MLELILFCALCAQQFPVGEILNKGGSSLRETTVHPRPETHRIFLAGVVALAAAESADAFTTRRLLDRGGTENNAWLLGRRPSPGRQAGMTAGLFAAQVGVFYFTERSRHRWIRWTGRALLGTEIVVHGQLAACNAAVAGTRERCPRL